MNKVICTTTIHPPTEALRKFAAMSGWKLVVAGDQKTPHHLYDDLECEYLSPAWQLQYDCALSDAIGWNCIQRRNFAFLYAAKEMKADIVMSCDDDNIPFDNRDDILPDGSEIDATEFHVGTYAFDPLSATSLPHLWHRGFPLELLSHRSVIGVSSKITPDVVAALWLGDPDVDALCRMEHAPHVPHLEARYPFFSKKPSPFNSQNTFLSKAVMPHYFMQCGVGRSDDIWAGFHVQAQGFRVAYSKPSVYQQRNPHNILDDMRAEYLGYENNLAIVKQVPINKNAVLDFLPQRGLDAFRLYQKHFE